MQTSLELIYHDVPRSDWSEDLIRDRVKRLERYRDDIVSCSVIVSQPHHHQNKGNPFRLTIEVRLPRNRRLTVVKEPANIDQQSDLKSVITAAFSSMERRLKGAGEAHRRDALAPGAEESRGLITELFDDPGYGYLRTPDGREYYFHYNAVLHGDFPRLTIGTEVRFEPFDGEGGPQASSVQIVNKPGARESENTRGRQDGMAGYAGIGTRTSAR